MSTLDIISALGSIASVIALAMYALEKKEMIQTKIPILVIVALIVLTLAVLFANSSSKKAKVTVKTNPDNSKEIQIDR